MSSSTQAMSFDFQVARYMHSQMPGCVLVKFLSLDSNAILRAMLRIEKPTAYDIPILRGVKLNQQRKFCDHLEKKVTHGGWKKSCTSWELLGT